MEDNSNKPQQPSTPSTTGASPASDATVIKSRDSNGFDKPIDTAKAPARVQRPSKGRMVMYNLPECIVDDDRQLAADIVRVHADDEVDLFVKPDGTHNIGVVTRVKLGTAPGTWSWPVFV